MSTTPSLPKRSSVSTASLLVRLSLTALTMTMGCRSRETPRAAPISPPAASATRPAAPAPSAAEITVSSQGKAWVTVVARGDALTVTSDGVALFGAQRSDGKRKYGLAQGGATLLEVKPRADEPGSAAEQGFKLRDADGKLLWKVKIADEKIKIADDEEGAHAFVISAKDPAAAVIAGPDGRPLGRVRLDAATHQAIGEDASGQETFRAPADLPTGVFGVLLVDAISRRDRGVILAELAVRAPAR